MISNTALFEKESNSLDEEPTFLRLFYLWGLRDRDVIGRSYHGIFLTKERARISVKETHTDWEDFLEIVKLSIGVLYREDYKEVKE